jgi:hypothetical protein
MRPETAGWIEIAEGDFLTATREAAADVPKSQNKALLTEAAIKPSFGFCELLAR